MNQAQIPKNSENTFTQKFGFPSEKATGKIVNYLKDIRKFLVELRETV